MATEIVVPEFGGSNDLIVPSGARTKP